MYTFITLTMAISSIQWAFIALLNLATICIGAPIHDHDVLLLETSTFSSNIAIALSIGILILCAVLLFGCTCCPHKDGTITNSSQCPIRHLNQNNISQLQHNSEFAIFPPCSSVISLQPVHSGGFGNETEKIIFEPLPDILPKRHVNGQNLAQSSKPAHFSALLKKKNSLHDWFDDPSSNFPRNQLQYLREMGNGWFGRVVEGEAQKITEGQEKKTPVMVKILREEASPSEHLYFLHEVRPYRNLQHANVLRLLGRCLETDPFLLIMEHTVMDLKSYLIKHHDTFMKKDDLGNEQLLQWALDITSGLMHMHEHGFTHTDLAAHNCFLTIDNCIKIGDYGLSFNVFREDYYCLGDIALPIRWYSPETLLCSETTIEAKDSTKEANIWSLAVVFWELLEFGKLPYADMNNEDVLQNVIIERSVQLKAPQLHHPHKEQMFQVMRLCWNPPPLRPKIQEIEMLLRQIYEHKDFLKSFASFEERWNALQSESNSVTRDIMLRFENDFVPNADNRSASIFSTEGNVSESSAFELSGSEVMQRNFDSYLSASLRGLNGSFDEIGASDFEPANVPLAASGNASARGSFSNSHSIFDDNSDSLQNLEVVTPEEISEAIRDLDAMLATEAMLLGVDSRSTTLERPKDKCKHLNHEDYMPSDGVSKLQKLNEYDIDCSEPETNMETSDISCPKLIVEKDIYERTVSLYSPISSIQYFESDDDTPIVSPDDDILRSSLESKFIKPPVVTSNEGLEGDFEDNESENKPYSLFDHHTITVPAPSTSDPKGSDSWQKNNNSKVNEIALASENRLPLIPDIVIDPSVSCEENDSYDSEKCETNEKVSALDLPKPKLRNFRFVLKEDSVESLPSKDSDLLNISIENNAQEGVEKSLESSGPLTSTPTKDIAFFNDDRFHNLNQSSEELCSDISLISYKTSTATTNSECYESAANTLTSEIALNSTDYETAASTFNLTNGSIFNLSNESITDPSVIDTVFGNSHTFTKDVTSSTGITESSSFSYVEPKSDLEVQLSPLSTTQHDSQISDTSENVTGLPEDIQNDGCISGLLDYEAEALPHTQNVALPNTIKNSDSCVNTTSNFSNVLDTFHPSHTIGEMQDDSQQNEDCTSRDWSSSQNQTDSREFAVIELLNEGEETGISDTVSDSFAFKKECEWSVMDDTSTEALTFSEGLTQSISDTISDSFTYDKSLAFDKLVNQSEVRSELTDSSLFVKPPSINSAPENSSDNSSSNLINHNIEKINSTTFTTNSEYHLGGQEEMTIEDLETEESASYVISDNYDEPLDEDDVLKIDVETNEAILVDSTQSLIGFVPSRSIEMLQECNDIASHYDAPMLDSLTVEETGSSSTSPASFSPQNVNLDVISSQCNGMIVEHLNCSAESSPVTIFSSSEELVSDDENLDNKHQITNTSTATLELNNNAECDSISPDPYNDVIFSTQPTKSVVWHSDETLDILDENEPNGNSCSVIIESREIMAGSNYSTEIQMDDTKSGLDNEQFGSSDFLDRLAISPASSPQDSVASTPCRDIVYTPDFESESEDSSSSCSSTSGSFECIHNKFKDIGDISVASEEVSKEPSPPISDEKDSKETSPMKIFSTTWDCHATPNKGLLKTPEKKVLPMRKSVSFHDEPQLVFQYPPASDSSEEDCVEDANEFSWHVDYTSYADWDLQVSEEDDIPEEMIEIEELDSEPYNRSLYRRNRPLSQPAMYTITGFSDDEDLDLPEMKGSSQFSTIPDFRLSSERESPVRVSTINQGLTLIKEGPDDEEEFTIEEVFTGVNNTEEKSAANDDVIKIQITFPDSEIVEPVADAVHESNHVNHENINEISKTISDLDLPMSIKEGANVENDIVHQVPAIEIKEISINEQPLSNLVVLNSNENKLSKLETGTCNILGSESLNDHSPTMEIIPEAISPSHRVNSHVNIEISNKNHFMISERILEDDNGFPTHTNEGKTANAHGEDPGDINKDSVENINSAVSMDAEKEVLMDTDMEISMNTDKEVFRNANKQVSVDADKEEVSMNAEQEVSESGNKGVSMTDGRVFANTDGKVCTSNDKKVSTSNDKKVSTSNGKKVSTDIDRKISTDINMEVSMDIDRKVSTDIDRKVSTAINNEVAKDVKKMVTQDANREITRDVDEEKVSEDAGGEIHLAADKADVENTDKDIPTDAHKEVVNKIEKNNTRSENQSKDPVNECVSDTSRISENNLLSDLSSPTLLDEKNSLGKNTVMVTTVSHENDCGEKTNGTFSQSLKHTESSDNESVSCSNIAMESVKCSSHNAELDMAEDESNMVPDSQLNTKADNAGLESMISETAINIDDSVTNSVSVAIPLIVVTDTGEEFIDGENLGEFLSDHLKFYENEAGNAAEFCKDDGFVVTSDFSETPFEDPFGYYNGRDVNCDDDFNFVEAVNRHCSAQAFDDLLNFTEDAPLQNGYIPTQSSVDEIPTERSTSLPVMNDEKAIKTEKPLGFSSL